MSEGDQDSELRSFALRIGFDLVGAADVSGLRESFLLEERTRRRYTRAVSLGKRLNGAVLEDLIDRPTALYFHHYRQTNAFLDRGALLVADFIEKHGHRALAIPASQIVDWENQKAHLSHKQVGRAAGLGWIGRNNLLVHPEYGARFRLVTVLTDMPLEPGAPLTTDCGACRACMASCPAGAIREEPGEFDHLACFEKLREFRKKGFVPQFICGLCVRDCRGWAAPHPE